MPVTSSDIQLIRSDTDVVVARQAVRRLCQQIRFSLVDQTKMVTAASEIARNTLIYGRGGAMRWEIIEDAAKRGLRLRFEDEGPGIPDIELALRDGWTSGNGLGKGLPGTRRLVHEFDIQSTPGKGTAVTILRWA